MTSKDGPITIHDMDQPMTRIVPNGGVIGFYGHYDEIFRKDLFHGYAVLRPLILVPIHFGSILFPRLEAIPI